MQLATKILGLKGTAGRSFCSDDTSPPRPVEAAEECRADAHKGEDMALNWRQISAALKRLRKARG